MRVWHSNTITRGTAVNACAQACLCLWAKLRRWIKNLHRSKDRVLPLNDRIHYSVGTVWRVSPYGLLSWIRWAASRAECLSPVASAKSDIVDGPFSDGNVIQRGFQMDKWDLAFLNRPHPDGPALSLTLCSHIVWYAPSRLRWNGFKQYLSRCFAVTCRCVENVIPASLKLPSVVDTLKQYRWRERSSSYFVLTWIGNTAVSEIIIFFTIWKCFFASTFHVTCNRSLSLKAVH